MAEKIVQTAGRDALGTFAPDFAHFNDDVLFGENWNNEDIDLKTRETVMRFDELVVTVRESNRSLCHLSFFFRICQTSR